MKKNYLFMLLFMGIFLFGTAQDDDCGECEGQITYLNLQFTGDETGTVKVYEGKVKEDKLFFEEENVSNGSEFSFVGPKNHNKMGSKIFLTINDGDAVEIHTSCSQDIYAGMEFGNRYLILDGTSYEGGPLCYYEEEDEEDCGECEGQITFLELQYQGAESGEITVFQKNKKDWVNIYTGSHVTGDIFSFSGVAKHDKMGAKIYLYVDGENKTEIHTSCSQDIYAGQTWGDYLIVSGESHEGGPLCALPPECEIEDLCDVLPATADIEPQVDPNYYMNLHITNGDWLDGDYPGWCIDTENSIAAQLYENADVYCSYETLPVGIVDKPENLDLVNWVLNQDFIGQASVCNGNFTYSDMQYAIWTLLDDNPENGQGLDENEWEPCRAAEIVTAAMNNGEDFEPVPGELFVLLFDPGVGIQNVIIAVPFTCPEDPEECGECEGQITSLDLEYQGTETNATITVYKGKVEPGKELAVFTNVNNGDTLSFVGDPNKQNKMGSKIRITVEGVDGYNEIHTSCSQDIYAGQTWGDYYIIAGESHEGGPLCYYEDDDEGEDCGECEGQITYLKLQFTGDETGTVKVYEGKVKEDKLFFEEENVSNGSEFSFVGPKNDNKMGAKIFLTIDDGEAVEIHTSCSQDIYTGMEFGNRYLILEGESHEGGPLCEYDPNKSAGIDNNAHELIVYPNPMSNSGTLMFFAAENANTTVEVYNLVGTRVDMLFNDYVEAGSQTRLSIDANKYPKGMYIIYIRNGSSTMKEKLSIMN